jgi:hypothetical protein
MQASKPGTETTAITPAPVAAPAPVVPSPVVASVAKKPGSKAAAKPVVKAAAKKAAPTKAAPKKPAAKPLAKAAVKTASKPAPKATPKATAKPDAKPDAKAAKEKKIKMVRDSISIPKTEYTVLDDMKLRAGKLGVAVKKTELIRAGIKALAALSDSAFLAAVRAVPNLKTGRPAKAA